MPGDTLSHLQQYHPDLNLNLDNSFYWIKDGEFKPIPNDAKVHKALKPTDKIYIPTKKQNNQKSKIFEVPFLSTKTKQSKIRNFEVSY